MNEIDETNLTDQTRFRLNEVSKIEIILTKQLIKENYAVKKSTNILLLLIT